MGQWGVKVSEVSLGTWLTHDRSTGEEVAIQSTRCAYEQGVNLFDTANEYQVGRAEEVLGRAVAVFERDTYLVATKVCSPMGDGPLERGLSRKHILAQVDGSLRRLGLEHIDLYQCHRYDDDTPLEETAETMNDLVRWGKVLYWGVSEWSADQLAEVVALCRRRGWAIPVCDQLHYSALWTGNEESVFPVCESVGMGTLAFAPLAHGVLTGKYRSEGGAPKGTRGTGADSWVLRPYFRHQILAAVQNLRELAESHGHTTSQLALAWCLRNRAVSSVLVGVSNISQLKENISATELTVDPEVIAKADAILDPVRLTYDEVWRDRRVHQ